MLLTLTTVQLNLIVALAYELLEKFHEILASNT